MSKAAFFDLDNTLVHRDKSIAAYSEKFSNDYYRVLSEVDADEIANVIYSQDNGGYLTINSPYKTIKDAVSNELHKLFSRGSSVKVEDVREHWINNFPENAVPMHGANELLSYLSDQGCYVGIISNGADKSRKSTARRLESFCHIKQIVSSESAGVSKPSIEIFTMSALDAGFTPDQCWFIGDHPVNDIDGARKAGMQTIWLNGFHSWPENLQCSNHSIDALAEVKSILASNSNKSSKRDAVNGAPS